MIGQLARVTLCTFRYLNVKEAAEHAEAVGKLISHSLTAR